MTSRRLRIVAVVGVIGLLSGAFVAAPAEAKKKKRKACAPYAPGEDGAEAETTVVTDKATAEAPIEVTVATDPGLGFTSPDPHGSGDQGPTAHAYYNVQMDSKKAANGLFVRVEFAPAFDYDLFLRDADANALAYAAGFNQAPAPGTPIDGTGNGGHSEVGAEVIDGYMATDCEGFTIDIASASTPGGDVTVKLYLGEPEG